MIQANNKGKIIRIGVVGLGYVGFTTALAFTSRGFEVICFDRDGSKVDSLNQGSSPYFEKGTDNLLDSAIVANLVVGVSSIGELVGRSDVTFICVGTPSSHDGKVDLDQVKTVSRELGVAIRSKRSYHHFIVKSTVPPGTTAGSVRDMLEVHSGKKYGVDFGLAMCPEFMKQGSALEDTFEPDRLVFGTVHEPTKQLLLSLYDDYDSPKLFVSPKTAEMIKYVSNSFLATKISFANEMANLCEMNGADVDLVFQGVGLDSRINPTFFRAGIGYGGSCFLKDVRGIINIADADGLDLKILKAVDEVNNTQYLRLIEILEEYGPLKSKTIALLGLAFKPETDDVRESRSLLVARRLLDRGAELRVYDPKAMDNFRKALGLTEDEMEKVHHSNSAVDALGGADAALLLTEWDEFNNLTERDFVENMNRPILIDGRRMFAQRFFHELEYRTIGAHKSTKYTEG